MTFFFKMAQTTFSKDDVVCKLLALFHALVSYQRYPHRVLALFCYLLKKFIC